VTIAINDVPVNTAPGAQAGAEDTPLAIGGISVLDVDGGPLSVTLTVASGALNVNLAGGASVIAGSNGGTSVTLFGTQPQLNAALATLAYTGAADWSGADTLTVTTTDPVGASSAGAVNIAIAAVNDAPVLGANNFAIAAGKPMVLGSTNLSATDVDNAYATLVFQVSAIANGQFELVSAPGQAIASFTQAQLAGGQVQFVHAGTAAPSFTIMLSDGSALAGPYAANIVFTQTGATDPIAQPRAPEAPITLAALSSSSLATNSASDIGGAVATSFLRGPASAADLPGDRNFAEATGPVVAAAPSGVVRAE
jgi:hypothetical protein